jgi:hypothetical protein
MAAYVSESSKFVGEIGDAFYNEEDSLFIGLGYEAGSSLESGRSE